MCGGEKSVDAILRGEKKVTIEDVIRLLVDKNGRCIKQPQVVSAVCDANTSFHLYTLPAYFKFQFTIEVTDRIEAIKAMIASNPHVANLLKGSWYPILLPQTESGDYGTLLEEILLPRVEESYTKAFPGRKFYNHRKSELAGQITIVDERHAQLLADLTKGTIPGILFFPLQGFSVHAQRQMAKLMPDNIFLAGAIEIAVAEATYPKFLVQDGHTSFIDCSAVQWRNPDFSLCFRSFDDEIGFDLRCDLDVANGIHSGALFCRG